MRKTLRRTATLLTKKAVLFVVVLFITNIIILMQTKVGVDYRGQNTVKFVQDEKYSSKRSDSLRFYAYLCHVMCDFACLETQH